MIAFIRGVVMNIDTDSLVVDTGNIGYTVFVPMSMLKPFPKEGEEIMLHTYLQVKEDGWSLFGFADVEQLSVFKTLLSVSGIGARSALNIIDTLTVKRIILAIGNKDIAAFTAVSGIGKKTAERLMLELKDKFKSDISVNEAVSSPAMASSLGEAAAALMQLGFSPSEARALSSQAAMALGDNAAEDKIIKEALRLSAKI